MLQSNNVLNCYINMYEACTFNVVPLHTFCKIRLVAYNPQDRNRSLHPVPVCQCPHYVFLQLFSQNCFFFIELPPKCTSVTQWFNSQFSISLISSSFPIIASSGNRLFSAFPLLLKYHRLQLGFCGELILFPRVNVLLLTGWLSEGLKADSRIGDRGCDERSEHVVSLTILLGLRSPTAQHITSASRTSFLSKSSQ